MSRRLLGVGAAAVAGAAVASVAGAGPAGAQTAGLRSGTVSFAPGETSKQVAVTGLTSSSVAFAMPQSPLASKGSRISVLVAHPDPTAGTVTIEINDGDPSHRFFNAKVGWLVVC